MANFNIATTNLERQRRQPQEGPMAPDYPVEPPAEIAKNICAREFGLY